jgi:pilus assembly protein CpaC
MSNQRFAAAVANLHLPAVLALIVCWSSLAQAQPVAQQGVHFRVSGAAQRLEMIVNTSRILTLEYNVPRLLVDNPEIVRALPLSPNQIQVSALKPGLTQINIWDEKKEVHAIDVLVYGDARELHNLLKSEFPDASLHVRPLASSVIISGFVSNPDSVSRIVRIAEDYYPKVINNMQVGGVQQVLLHVKVMEVSRTKLRQMGVDWAALSGNDFLIQSVSGIVTAATSQGGTLAGQNDTLRFGILNGSNAVGGYLDLLRKYNLAKLLAEPTLVAVSGRAARFHSGGEFGYVVPSSSLNATQVAFKPFGTEVDFVPIVLGNGNIRLEVRPTVSEVDASLGANGVPGFRIRSVDTAVEMKAGQTLALAGLIQTRVESENKGLPWASDLPWIGAAFRRVREQVNEVELLIMVTPELVEAMDPHEVPPCGPGQLTTSPSDTDFYWRGYLEVPRCDGNCNNYPPGGPSGEYIQPQGPAVPNPQDSPVPLPQGASSARTTVTFPPLIESGDPRRSPNYYSNESPAPSPPKYTPISSPNQPTPAARPENSSSRYNRNSGPVTRSISSDSSDESGPKFIGPTGYDVLK